METFSKPGRSPGGRRGAGKATVTETISIPSPQQCRIHNVFNKSNRFYKLKYDIIVFTYDFKPNRNVVAVKKQEKVEKKRKKRRKSPGRPGEKWGVKAGRKIAGGKANPAQAGAGAGPSGKRTRGAGPESSRRIS